MIVGLRLCYFLSHGIQIHLDLERVYSAQSCCLSILTFFVLLVFVIIFGIAKSESKAYILVKNFLRQVSYHELLWSLTDKLVG